MNKELSDKAWRVLPAEFREEVKKIYKQYSHGMVYTKEILEQIFGSHNLTSDADGEEMLTVSRKKVQKIYAGFIKEASSGSTDKCNLTDIDLALTRASDLFYLFGNKCHSGKSYSELKFSKGDPVVFHPFKSDSFCNAKILDIEEGSDKPYLLHLDKEGDNIWAYPIEVQSISETYSSSPEVSDF